MEQALLNPKRYSEIKALLREIANQHGENVFARVNEELRSNREFVLAAVKQNCKCLKYIAEDLRSDKYIFLAAHNSPHSSVNSVLEHAGDRVCALKDVVLAAVSVMGFELEYASKELQDDREVVLTAVNNMGGALKYASANLRSDKKLVLRAIKSSYKIAPHYYTYTEDYFREVIFSLEHAGEDLKGDREVVLSAVGLLGSQLEFANDDLRADKEVVLAAAGDTYFTYGVNPLRYVSEELKAWKKISSSQKRKLYLGPFIKLWSSTRRMIQPFPTWRRQRRLGWNWKEYFWRLPEFCQWMRWLTAL